MANVSAFTQVLGQFLDELTQTFPEQTSLKKYKATFELLKKANPRKIMTSFTDSAAPYADKIMAMDETFFLNGNIEFLDALDVHKWWTPDLSPSTKQSIWQFLQYLLVTGGVVKPQMPQMPSGVEEQIHALAESIPKPSDGQRVDLDSIPIDAVMNIAKQFQPDADISADHVKQAMGMVKDMMASQEGTDATPDQLMQNLMKSMGGNFSK